jgi:hypothetical protein
LTNSPALAVSNMKYKYNKKVLYPLRNLGGKSLCKKQSSCNKSSKKKIKWLSHRNDSTGVDSVPLNINSEKCK